MSRRVVTGEIFQKMYNDYKQGFSCGELCEKYGFNKGTIQRHFNQRGFYFSNARQFSIDELNNIINDYKNGMRPYKLAEKYNRDSGTIIGKLQDMGVYKRSTHRFTDEEIACLKTYYPDGNWDKIQETLPNVSREAIYTKMSSLGITMNSFFWSDKEVELLTEYYESKSGKIDELVDLFNGKFTYEAIISKAGKLGLKNREFWDDNEVAIMNENYHCKTLDEMMALLPNRSRDSIIGKARKLGLKNCCKYRQWEIQHIIDNWEIKSDIEIAQDLNRSFRSVKWKRQELGFLRAKEESSYNNISEYVRKNNNEWKTLSMVSCGYKCALTGNRFDNVHHIHGFNLILNETIEELCIDIKDCMDDYTGEELIDILAVFRKKQSEYPLGVCLCKDIHKLFHRNYGYGDNTQEQWDEFVKNFKNNKYQISVA